ncbi:MAG: hypothetical protein R3281_08160 [Balneolaceae bacterium]|nr:hypothetical protein [Balneolaceae bacterium]
MKIILLPLAMTSMGMGSVLYGIFGLFSGYYTTRTGTVTREDQPIFYWSLLLLSQAAGWFFAVTGILFLIYL